MRNISVQWIEQNYMLAAHAFAIHYFTLVRCLIIMLETSTKVLPRVIFIFFFKKSNKMTNIKTNKNQKIFPSAIT